MPDTRLETFVRRGPELTAAELHALLRLRVDVFVVEQDCPYPEIDGRDLLATTEHRWLAPSESPQEIAAAIRLLADDGDRRIGRVVTDEAARGRGLARQLVLTAIETFGDEALVLDAQSHLVAYYSDMGFVVSGEEFIEDGIPHRPMRRLP